MSFRGTLRLALRRLREHPGLHLVALLTLGVGLALPVAAYSILDGTLLRGLPIPRSEQLVVVKPLRPDAPATDWRMPARIFFELRERQDAFEGLGAFLASYFYVSTTDPGPGGGTVGAIGALITGDLFDLLEVPPALGRGLRPEDEASDAPEVAVLGHRLWEDLFAGDPRVLGRTILVNRQRVTVVGVMPEGFAFPFRQQVWMPLRLGPASLATSPGPRLFVVGRLGQQLSRRQAQAHLDTLAPRLAVDGSSPGASSAEPLRLRIDDYTTVTTGADFRLAVYGIFLGALLLYLLCASNLLHLILISTARRSRDLAIATALGASRWSLALRQIIGWLPLLALTTLLGLAVAEGILSLFTRLARTSGLLRAFWVDVRLDLPALFFALGLASGLALLGALAPVLGRSASRLRPLLAEGGGAVMGGFELRRTGRALVVLQVTIATVLLIPALLVALSLSHLWQRGRDLADPSVLTARLSLYNAEFASIGERRDLFRTLLSSLASIPGTEAVALSSAMPTEGVVLGRFEIGRSGGEEASVEVGALQLAVSPGFFDLMHLDLLSGRTFEEGDREAAGRVVVVSRSFSENHLGGEAQAVGTPLRPMESGDGDGALWTVIGVVSDRQLAGFGDEAGEAAVYLPWELAATDTAHVFLRAKADARSLGPELRRRVSAVHSRVACSDLRTLDEVVAQSAWTYRFFGFTFLSFGGASLWAAGAGIYSILGFLMASRTRELGLRSALGATPRSLGRLVLREGLTLVFWGLGIGIAGALFPVARLRVVLWGLEPTHPMVWGATLLLILGLGTLACLVPARQAARTDPGTILRGRGG